MTAPPSAPDLISLARPRLLRQLQTALRRGHAAILAPAGYGKTVLLHSLAAHRPDTYYLALSPADADLAVLRARLASAQRVPRATLLLDDVQHLLAARETLDWLLSGLEQDDTRFVLCGRQLELPATRARVSWLSAVDLAFTAQEARLLLAGYGDSSATAWHARAAGWPLALALLRHARGTAAPPGAPGAGAPLFDYLARTVLAGLVPEVHAFLCATAVPLRFNLALAAFLLELSPAEAEVLLRQAQASSLLLEDEPGWFHYHELVRDFLVQQAGPQAPALFGRAVAWLETQDDPALAIEQAAAGRLDSELARLLKALPQQYIWTKACYRTFRRWVLSLGLAARQANPNLLVRLGREWHGLGWFQEGREYIQEGLALAETLGDVDTRNRAWLSLATAYAYEGRPEECRAVCATLLDDPAVYPVLRLRTLMIQAGALVALGELNPARATYAAAIALSDSLDQEETRVFCLDDIAKYIHIPRGQWAAARRLLAANDAYFADRIGLRVSHLLGYGALHAAAGDWEALAELVRAAAAIQAQVEEPEAGNTFWLRYWSALAALGRGDLAAAPADLQAAAALAGEHADRQGALALAEVWRLRRAGLPAQALAAADGALRRAPASPLYQARLALERELAAFESSTASSTPAIELSLLADGQSLLTRITQLRLAPEWVRLRALLALRCQQAGDPRWRHHYQAASRAVQRPAWRALLTRRDPELGQAFWALGIAEDESPAAAAAALRELGAIAPLVRVLQHASPTARGRAAQALGTMGQEAAMPSLAAALRNEPDPAAQAAMQAALTRLEAQPPPPLQVTLLGEFALRRGGQLVAARAWRRPIVRRLFQYFALHRGEWLARDQILDDLWGETDPQSAGATFRTVFSWLRGVLEPHLRSKVPARYFSIQDERYCFDAYGWVSVDAETFAQLVRGALTAGAEADVPPVPGALLAALEGWQPLLPEWPYADWLALPRERLHGQYLAGCQYVAQACLVREDWLAAEAWAERVRAAAPWMEEAYQVLMRSRARRGERSLALKVYAEAEAALARELGAPPSRLTTWLAERLRRGEDI